MLSPGEGPVKPILQLLVGAYIVSMLHVLFIALCARLHGVPIKLISLGIGPTLATRGRVRLALVPGGFVRLKDTRSDSGLDPRDHPDAYDQQPRLVQVSLALGAPLLLLALCLVVLGETATHAFLRAFEQMFKGALSPLGVAQSYLVDFERFASSNAFVSVVALIGAKAAAYNLLPLPTLNGGDALLALCRPASRVGRLEERARIASAWLLLALMLSWLLALLAWIV